MTPDQLARVRAQTTVQGDFYRNKADLKAVLARLNKLERFVGRVREMRQALNPQLMCEKARAVDAALAELEDE